MARRPRQIFRHRTEAPELPEKVVIATVSTVANHPITRRRKGQLPGGRNTEITQPIMKVAKHWYSDEEKINACTLYASLGSNLEVSKLTGIHTKTLIEWKGTEWWGELMRKIRFEMNDELDAKMTKIVDKALDKVVERIETGDYYVDKKTGKVKQIPMKGRDLAVVSSTIMDKRQLIRGEPTSISSRQVKEDDRLTALAAEFSKFVKARTIEVSATKEGDITDVTVQGTREESTLETSPEAEDRGEVAPSADQIGQGETS